MTTPAYTAIEGGVTAPKGFRAAGVAAGIKPNSTKKDCALIVSDGPAALAGTFTTNLFKAPPAQWTEQVAAKGRGRGVFINSGNANACTGDRGYNDARITAEQLAPVLGATAEEIGVLSTGVIGVTLPMERITQGVRGCLEALSPNGGMDAALAIMTTDTVPKVRAYECALSTGVIRMGAIAKGAGMIAPNMATMISVITTDAAVAPEDLRAMLKAAVHVSFNQMCVDNDMSTSDCVLCFANGAAGLPQLQPGTPDYDAFKDLLTYVCTETAKAMVRDGEGATKFVEIVVEGAATEADARTIARAIAVSHLCKTAFYGQDPNWGRIACAAGYCGVKFNPQHLCIWIDDVAVMCHGMPAVYEEADAAACMQKPEFRLRLEVGAGPGRTVFWTSDLSHKYVEINADYRT